MKRLTKSTVSRAGGHVSRGGVTGGRHTHTWRDLATKHEEPKGKTKDNKNTATRQRCRRRLWRQIRHETPQNKIPRYWTNTHGDEARQIPPKLSDDEHHRHPKFLPDFWGCHLVVNLLGAAPQGPSLLPPNSGASTNQLGCEHTTRLFHVVIGDLSRE